MKVLMLAISFLILIQYCVFSQCSVGTVLSLDKISGIDGGFLGELNDYDSFSRVAVIGDLDKDGVIDLAVGAPGESPFTANNTGVVWILFMNEDNTVRSQQKIGHLSGGFGQLEVTTERFGYHVASIGDLNNDGNVDIAVGCAAIDDGPYDSGGFWILFLNTDGTVKDKQQISNSTGNFSDTLNLQDYFGYGITSMGDLDNDGVIDLAVASTGDDDGGVNRGAIYILFMDTNGTVKSQQKISALEGDFVGASMNSNFGRSVENIGDMDGDGVNDLAVGVANHTNITSMAGAVWILFLNSDGTVKSHQLIDETNGGFSGVLEAGDLFGCSISNLGDIDKDGIIDIAVNSNSDDGDGMDRGSIWILFLDSNGTVKSHQKIDETIGGLGNELNDSDRWGTSLSTLKKGNRTYLCAGNRLSNDGGVDRGAVFIMELCTNHRYSISGTVYANDIKVVDCEVQLFDADLDSLQPYVSTVQVDINGDFIFDDIEFGNYKLLAIPGSGYGMNYLATWYVNKNYWRNAHVIPAIGNVGSVDVSLLSIMNVDNLESVNEIQVFPNPAKGKISINNLLTKKELIISMFDITGNQSDIQLNIEPYMGNVEIDVGGLASGMYYLKIVCNQQTIIKRVVLL